MKLPTMKIASALALFCSITLPAFGQYASLQVPKQVQYQGRVATATGGAWAGTEGYFVFALVQGATVLWNNWQGTASPADPGTVSLGSGQVLTLPVNQGVFSIRLGDGSGTNQQIPATVFFDSTANTVRTGVKLAVWFSPDDITFTRLNPDVEFTAVPFAMVAGIAETVQARAVTPAMLNSTAGVPVGAIVAWWGTTSNIPEGFELCNGNAPTTAGATLTGNKPNFLGRFPRGSASADVKTSPLIGGTDSVDANVTGGTPLSTDQIPPHSHPHNISVVAGGGGHQHSYPVKFTATAAGGYSTWIHRSDVPDDANTPTNLGGQHNHDIAGGILNNSSLGLAHTHSVPGFDNRPAYLEVLYIIRVK